MKSASRGGTPLTIGEQGSSSTNSGRVTTDRPQRSPGDQNLSGDAVNSALTCPLYHPGMPSALRSAPEPLTSKWDVCIDLTGANADIARPIPRELVDEVRKAVEVLPGAGHVSVEVHDQAPPRLRWLVLYPARSALPQEGPEWDERRDRVEHAVRGVTGVW